MGLARGVCGTRGLPEVLANMSWWMGILVKGSAAIMEAHAKKWEQTLKTNHPWDNKSGDTEKAISGGTSASGHFITAYLSHGTEAGYWLETRCDLQKFRALEKTIQADLPSLTADLKKLFVGGQVPLTRITTQVGMAPNIGGW